MVNKCVYLAGPISGLTWNEATDWRQEVSNQLLRGGIKAISPLRAKVYLRECGPIKDHYTDNDIDVAAFTNMSTPRGITTRDKFDCTRCSVIFVNLLGTTKVSIGTMIELGWANAHNIPVVLVIEEKDNIHDHAMVNELTGFRVKTIEEGIKVVQAILGDY